MQEFNPKLAESFLFSAQLRDSMIEPLRENAKRFTNKKAGYIYILQNRFIPGLVKIGCSDKNPIKRSHELSSFIGALGQFEIVFSCRIFDANDVQKKLHLELSTYCRDYEVFESDAYLAQVKIKSLLASWGLIR